MGNAQPAHGRLNRLADVDFALANAAPANGVEIALVSHPAKGIAALWLVAPLLLVVFGTDFVDAVAVLRMLAWLPTLQVLRALLNFHVIHHGQMQQIGWAYAIGGVVSVTGVAVFAPVYGLIGAVWASYAAEAAMVAFLIYGALRTYQSPV